LCGPADFKESFGAVVLGEAALAPIDSLLAAATESPDFQVFPGFSLERFKDKFRTVQTRD
jgi:hypothetical protein